MICIEARHCGDDAEYHWSERSEAIGEFLTLILMLTPITRCGAKLQGTSDTLNGKDAGCGEARVTTRTRDRAARLDDEKRSAGREPREKSCKFAEE